MSTKGSKLSAVTNGTSSAAGGAKKSTLFSDLSPKLSEETLNSIKDLGFTRMTPVQATTIPLFLQHKVRKVADFVSTNNMMNNFLIGRLR